MYKTWVFIWTTQNYHQQSHIVHNNNSQKPTPDIDYKQDNINFLKQEFTRTTQNCHQQLHIVHHNNSQKTYSSWCTDIGHDFLKNTTQITSSNSTSPYWNTSM